MNKVLELPLFGRRDRSRKTSLLTCPIVKGTNNAYG
jgi:hypothetical protein